MTQHHTSGWQGFDLLGLRWISHNEIISILQDNPHIEVSWSTEYAWLLIPVASLINKTKVASLWLIDNAARLDAQSGYKISISSSALENHHDYFDFVDSSDLVPS